MHLVWIDESGNLSQPITTEAKEYIYLAISFDAQYIAASANSKAEMLGHCNSDGRDLRSVISPDGKWLAYDSDYGGQAAIYVVPFPGPGLKQRGTSPL